MKGRTRRTIALNEETDEGGERRIGVVCEDSDVLGVGGGEPGGHVELESDKKTKNGSGTRRRRRNRGSEQRT